MQNVEKPAADPDAPLPYEPKDYPNIKLEDLLIDDEDSRYNKEGIRQSAVNSHLVRKDENGKVRGNVYNKGVILGPQKKKCRKRQPIGQALDGYSPWKLRKQAKDLRCSSSNH